YLYGRDVRPGARVEGATLVDVAPTVLALAGVTPARDMPGRVLSAALDIPDGPRTVATFETGTTVAAAAPDAPAVDAAVVEHLKSLGYLDSQSPRGDAAPATLA